MTIETAWLLENFYDKSPHSSEHLDSKTLEANESMYMYLQIQTRKWQLFAAFFVSRRIRTPKADEESKLYPRKRNFEKVGPRVLFFTGLSNRPNLSSRYLLFSFHFLADIRCTPRPLQPSTTPPPILHAAVRSRTF